MWDLYRQLEDLVGSFDGQESEQLDEASLMVAGSVCLMRRILEKQDRSTYSELMIVLSDLAHQQVGEAAEQN